MKPIVEISCKLLDWPLCTEFGPDQPIASIITLLRKYFQVPEDKSVKLMYGKKELKPEVVTRRWRHYNIKMKKTKVNFRGLTLTEDVPGKLELVVL